MKARCVAFYGKFTAGLIVAIAIITLPLDGTGAAENTEPRPKSGALTFRHIGVESYGGSVRPSLDAGGAPKGSIHVDQVLVRSFLPHGDERKLPVVFLPGFALSADIYLQTPDGREGWALQFARAGHPVYLVEPSRSSRASIDPSLLHAGPTGDAADRYYLFSWDQETAWRRFGFGPELGVSFADSQFDKAHFPALLSMFTHVMVPRVGGRRILDDSLQTTIAGVRMLLNEIGEAVLLVHSAAGVVAFELAKDPVMRLSAIVNIEPVGCPGEQAKAFPSIPVLSVFGDHYEYREQMKSRETACAQLVNELSERHVPARLLSLPAMGIRGNSHLLMSEKNGAEIAAHIIAWVAALPSTQSDPVKD